MLRESATAPPADAEASAGDADPATSTCLHASCVSLAGSGVVLLGPSGSGKSDLALRLIDGGGRLVADDRLVVERRGDRLVGRAPDSLAGLIEVRGLGIMRIAHCAATPLDLVVELGGARPWPRLPELTTYDLLEVGLPYIRLDPRAPSTCAKIKLALAAERVE
jgi:HPr kinase/phosphorylase